VNNRSNMVKVAVVGGGDAVLSALDKVAGKEKEHA
jgi:hypothetical protein